ncbi:hypothetical protein MIMGU_mgv1a022175mg [Erythranthe guttata]|uniref:Uncharacterized protein n=1 Tax=Erythranthe guttata TaxID=4155 RepID=A0A022RMM7_ERYGU|nr:hypothetical protein MIMGU_mgv1a022175mg [Erythranthe guttata]
MGNKAAKAIGTLTSFTCEICDERSLSTQKFRHGNSYAYCIGRHIKARVEGYNTEIKCPKLSCRRKLDPLECREIISPELFVKLCDSVCSSAVSGKKSATALTGMR